MPKKNSTRPVRLGARIKRKARSLLIGLLLILSVMVSGCQSHSQTPRCDALGLTVDPSLMAEPNFETRILQVLSEPAKTPTVK